MFNLLAQFETTTLELPQENETTGLLAFLAAFSMFFIVVGILGIIGLWKVFEKAGVDGWKAIIPVYNLWLLFEIAGKPGWWALVGLAGFIPILGLFASLAAFVLYVLAAIELGKAFKQTTVFTVLGLILFPVVGFLMLGFGNASYTKPTTVATS